MLKSSLILLGRIVQTALVLIQLRLIAYFLDGDELGSYFYVLGITQAFGLIIVSPIGSFLNRKLMFYEKSGSLFTVLAQFVGFLLVLGALAPVICMPLKFYLGVSFNPYVVGLIVFAVSFFNTIIPSLNLLGFTRRFIVMINLGPALGLLLALYFSYFRHISTHVSWLASISAGQILIASAAMIFLARRNSKKGDGETLFNLEMIGFAAPVSFVLCSTWFIVYGYRPVVEWFFGLTDLGTLALCLSVGTAATIGFEYLLQQILLPVFYRDLEKGGESDNAWLRYMEFFAPSSLIYCLGISMVAQTISGILIGDKFADYTHWVTLGIVADFFRMLTNAISLKFHGSYQTRALMLPYIFGALICFMGLLISCWLSKIDWIPWSLIVGQISVLASLLFTRSVGFRWMTYLVRDARIWMLIFLAFPLTRFQTHQLSLRNTSIAIMIGVFILSLVFILFKRGRVFQDLK